MTATRTIAVIPELPYCFVLRISGDSRNIIPYMKVKILKKIRVLSSTACHPPVHP